MIRLAMMLLYRDALLDQREDLDKAIILCTESILLSPLSQPQHDPIILASLILLATALIFRSNVSKQPGDVICATKLLSHLREQPHKIPAIPGNKVTELLVDALDLQVRLEAGNRMQNIREMAVLSLELLETSDIDATRLIALIHRVMISKIHLNVLGQPLDELIEFSRAAKGRRPDLLEGHITFAVSLVYRYHMNSVNDDYEEAVSTLDEIIANSSPWNCKDEDVAKARAGAKMLVTVLAMMRSDAYRKAEYLEEVIYRSRIFNSSSYKELYPDIVMDLESIAKLRFQHFGSIEGVEESSRNLVADDSDLFPATDKMKELLFRISNTEDTTEIMIEEAVKKSRSTLPSDLDGNSLVSFGDLLFEAFQRTKKIEYLNELISVRRRLIESPLPQDRLFPLTLLPYLLIRIVEFPSYRTQDHDEMMELYSQSVSSARCSEPDRFQHACSWAFMARLSRHSSLSTAYETALSITQDIVFFSPTLQLQHTTLAALPLHSITQTLSLDYASYLVDQNQLEEAIEVLDRGRALLWSEMRHLRTSIDQLLSADPVLGHKFASPCRTNCT